MLKVERFGSGIAVDHNAFFKETEHILQRIALDDKFTRDSRYLNEKHTYQRQKSNAKPHRKYLYSESNDRVAVLAVIVDIVLHDLLVIRAEQPCELRLVMCVRQTRRHHEELRDVA